MICDKGDFRMKHKRTRLTALAAAIMLSACRLTASAEALRGDLNSDGAVNRNDCLMLLDIC